MCVCVCVCVCACACVRVCVWGGGFKGYSKNSKNFWMQCSHWSVVIGTTYNQPPLDKKINLLGLVYCTEKRHELRLKIGTSSKNVGHITVCCMHNT